MNEVNSNSNFIWASYEWDANEYWSQFQFHISRFWKNMFLNLVVHHGDKIRVILVFTFSFSNVPSKEEKLSYSNCLIPILPYKNWKICQIKDVSRETNNDDKIWGCDN